MYQQAFSILYNSSIQRLLGYPGINYRGKARILTLLNWLSIIIFKDMRSINNLTKRGHALKYFQSLNTFRVVV